MSAVEAATETVAACARQGYRETAVVLDADGAIIAALRGDGAGIHTLDSASAAGIRSVGKVSAHEVEDAVDAAANGAAATSNIL
jgi:uncharacterized protein GlcG (DUF336 family)